MDKLCGIYVLFLVLFLATFSSANFACGEVTSNSNYLSHWMNVVLYYDGYESDSLDCTITGEERFCCDLDAIESVNWSSGLTVYAQVYDSDHGFVSQKESLVTSDSAYDLFNPLILEEAFVFNSDPEFLLVQENSQSFDISLHPSYSNFKVIVLNDGSGSEEIICEGCSSASFDLTFLPGTNTVSFIAYGEFQVFKTYDFYVLDSLEVDRSFSCDGCITQEDYFYIPANTQVSVTTKVETSHPIEFEFIEYIPSDWELVDSSLGFDYSESHNGLSFEVSGTSFETSYDVVTPNNFFQMQYVFLSNFDSFEYSDDIYIRRLFWLYLPIYFSEKFVEKTLYFTEQSQFISVEQPLVIVPRDDVLHLVAIYPSFDVNEAVFGKATVSKEGFFTTKYVYDIVSDLSELDIDRIFVQFKVEKGESIELYQGNQQIELETYKEDERYEYYGGFIFSKETFYVQFV